MCSGSRSAWWRRSAWTRRPLDGETPRDSWPGWRPTKARSVGGDPVLAADTVVDVDGEILGKPVDADDARRMLQRLSGRTHLVHTGVAVRSGDGVEIEVVTTSVRFTPLTPEAIEWYLATGEPFDKAGAYAIQGAGGAFVEEIQGSVSNVIGLPLTTVVDLLDRVGIRGFADPHPVRKPSGASKTSDAGGPAR